MTQFLHATKGYTRALASAHDAPCNRWTHPPTPMDSLTLIRDFVSSHSDIEPDKVVPEAVLADIGIDSLMLLEVMFEYEDKTGTKLPDDLDTPTTVQQLMDQLDQLQPGAES